MNFQNTITLIIIVLIISSCSGAPNIQDLVYKNDLAYINDEPYSGQVNEYYDVEEKNKKSIIYFEQGETLKKDFFSENGKLASDEIFLENNISKRNIYINGGIFISEDFENNSLEVADIICVEKCTVENIYLEDVTLESVHLSNVTFKNSSFKNVTLKGSNKKYTILDRVLFIDSIMEDMKIEEFVITYDPSSVLDPSDQYIKNECEYWEAEAWKESKWDIRRKECADEARTDLLEDFTKDYENAMNSLEMRNYSFEGVINVLEEYGISIPDRGSLFLQNISGNIKVNAKFGLIGLSIADSKMSNLEISLNRELAYSDKASGYAFIHATNSSFENLSYLNLKAEHFFNSNPYVQLKNTKVDYLSGLILSQKTSKKYRPSSAEGLMICENSEFKDGFLPLIINSCDDMGVEFDQFAIEDFEKKYLPDNSMYMLSLFSKKSSYEKFYGSERKAYSARYRTDMNNQRYAIASGDKEYLQNYLEEFYTYAVSSKGFEQVNSCLDNTLLNFITYNNKTPEGCETDNFSKLNARQWFALPEEARTPLDASVKILASQLVLSNNPLGQINRGDEKYLEMIKGIDFSAEGKKKSASNYVKNNHDLSKMKNCLRGKESQEATMLLSNVGEVASRSNEGKFEGQGRLQRARYILASEEASKKSSVENFKECIAFNVSIYTPQVIDAYKPFSDLAIFAKNEVDVYKNAEKRARYQERKRRLVEREKLFSAFIDNSGMTELCDAVSPNSPFASMIINSNFIGTSDQKQIRVERNFKACQRCVFNLYSSILNDSDFKKLSSGNSSDVSEEGARNTGMQEMKSLLMCPVAGADPSVRNYYRRSSGL